MRQVNNYYTEPQSVNNIQTKCRGQTIITGKKEEIVSLDHHCFAIDLHLVWKYFSSEYCNLEILYLLYGNAGLFSRTDGDEKYNVSVE